MYILITILLLVLNTHHVISLKKCCDSDSYLTKRNSIYFCDKDEDKRLQIFTKQTNYLKESNATEDYCFDGNKNITEYKIRNQTVIEENQIDVNFYPKCCPLNFYYNSVTHSCVWKNNTNDKFITQNFIRVGLPHCRVVVDYKLDSGNNHYRIELGTLYIGNSAVFHDGQFCVDMDENDLKIARGCYEDLNVCGRTKCIRKCCPDGQSFVNGKHCLNTYKHGLDLSFTNRINSSQDPFAIIHKYDCSRIYILREKIQFYLDTDGTFWAFYNKTNSFKRYGIDEKSYCIEHAYKEHVSDRFQFFMCFPEQPMKAKFVAARWAKIISSVFIVFTVVVYLFLPELLNLFGKILVSYCTAMLTVYIVLTYGQFVTDLNDKECISIGFLTLYTSLCSFSWLNIMCFDIWWTFGTPKSFVTAQQKRNEMKRFFLYSLYGWGIPANLTAITFLAWFVFNTPYVIRPFLGSYKCYWEHRTGNYAMFLYYATPLIFMEIANLVLFTKTLIYCLKVKSEINKINDNRLSMKERKKCFNADREQLFLILKLGVTMGISFVFEVVSSLYVFSLNPVTEYIEIIWDTFNCLQGVFIFIIFICKAKVLRLCRARIIGVKIRKISVSSLPTATTQVTAPLTSTSKIRNV